MSKWSVHFCLLDAECRKYGGASRLYFHMPAGSLEMALRRDDWFQLWLPWKTTGFFGEKSNYSRWWVPITWQPKRDRKGADSMITLSVVLVIIGCVGIAASWAAGAIKRRQGGPPSERGRHAAKVYDEMFGRDDKGKG